MASKPNPVAEDHAKRSLAAIKKHTSPIGLRELCAVVGMTDREGDAALKLLRRRRLAKYDKTARGWVLGRNKAP